MNIYEAVKYIVEHISLKWPSHVNYLYGSQREVQKQLMEWSSDPLMKEEKYPCVIMFTPIDQTRGEDGIKLITATTVDMVIVTNTEKDYHSWERVQQTYKPILWPIYELLIAEMLSSGLFSFSNYRVQHGYKDLFYYSATPAAEQNTFAAVLDAVELTGLQLDLLPQGCRQYAYDAELVHDGIPVVHDDIPVLHKIYI